MTGRERIEALKLSRPDVAIEVIRSYDREAVWDGDEPISDVYECFDHEVKAITIRKGVLIEASAYLGGSWYDLADKSADNLENLAEISGYLPQMIDEALDDLDTLIKDGQ